MPINMKTYLFTLLLFFLLVDTSSLSVPFGLGVKSRNVVGRFFKDLTKEVRGQVRDQAIDSIWQSIWDKQNSAPPQSNAPEEIKGLDLVKEYFYEFGHLPNSGSGPFTDYLDEDMISAIKDYQKYFNLEVTGQLDKETRQHISQPRCGVPDMNFQYSFFPTTNLSWPKGKQWFEGKKELTYGFEPASQMPLNVTKVFRDAFNQWSQAIGVLNLTEATAFDAADIKVGFYELNGTFQKQVVGDVVIELMQPGYNVKIVGEMRLDSNKYWALPSLNDTSSWPEGLIDLETVAMHKIGHLLGLDHSSMEDSVMYPSILPSRERKVQLTDDDLKNIQQLYVTSDGGRVTLVGSSWGLLTTLSLGFACMVLFY